VEVAASFGGFDPWLDFTSVSWADYDSDGDVDLLVCGEWIGPEDIEGRAIVYANQGGGSFVPTALLPAPLVGNAGGAFTWFDVDADGDLDYFVAGGYYVPGGNGLIEARTQLLRNDAIAANAAPAVPAGLSASVAGDEASLSWTASTDDRTPAVALTYEIEVVGGAAGPGGAPRVLPQRGNVGGNLAWTLRGLEPGAYTWTVRAVDNAFNGSAQAQGAFTIPSTTTGVGDDPQARLALSAPRPNPATARAAVTLTLDRGGPVEVAAYDVRGRRVATLHQGPLPAGTHALSLQGPSLPSGTYFIRATTGGRTAVRRITWLR
jgi:hypothetical protein